MKLRKNPGAEAAAKAAAEREAALHSQVQQLQAERRKLRDGSGGALEAAEAEVVAIEKKRAALIECIASSAGQPIYVCKGLDRMTGRLCGKVTLPMEDIWADVFRGKISELVSWMKA